MKEPFQPPTTNELEALTGKELHNVWTSFCQLVEQKYEMERLWNRAGKAWKYEYKYRRGGKTLCTLYAGEQSIGILIIFGKDERAKFESQRNNFSDEAQRIYDEATTYHDGKWVMFKLTDTSLFHDMEQFLAIKRRPNR